MGTSINDLGLLALKNKIFVSTLPKETQAVVVKYSSGIRVSCIIPPQSLKIKVVTSDEEAYVKTIKRCKIKTPDLLMSIKYSDVPNYKRVPVDEISLYAINTLIKTYILATPYRFANVYSTGKICWGSLPPPWDLKSAFNTFWSSRFTADLLGQPDDESELEDVMDYIKCYRTKILKHQKYENKTPLLCGDNFWAAPKGADGVLVTSEVELLKQIPKKYWIPMKNDEQTTPIVCLLANRIEEGWTFESGGYKFLLPGGSVAIQPAPNPKIEELKKKYAALPTIDSTNKDSFAVLGRNLFGEEDS